MARQLLSKGMRYRMQRGEGFNRQPGQYRRSAGRRTMTIEQEVEVYETKRPEGFVHKISHIFRGQGVCSFHYRHLQDFLHNAAATVKR